VWWRGRTWCCQTRALHATVVEPRHSHNNVHSAPCERANQPMAGGFGVHLFWQLSNVHSPQIAYASGTRCISLASRLSRPSRPFRCMNNKPWSPSAVTHDLLAGDQRAAPSWICVPAAHLLDQVWSVVERLATMPPPMSSWGDERATDLAGLTTI
jgi:hypothetical protein